MGVTNPFRTHRFLAHQGTIQYNNTLSSNLHCLHHGHVRTDVKKGLRGYKKILFAWARGFFMPAQTHFWPVLVPFFSFRMSFQLDCNLWRLRHAYDLFSSCKFKMGSCIMNQNFRLFKFLIVKRTYMNVNGMEK